MELIYIFFIIIKWGIYFLVPRAVLNVRTCGLSKLALFLDEGVASSSMRFLSYIYFTSFIIFFYFIVVDH